MFNKIFSKLKNNNEQNSEKFVDVGEHKFLKNFKKITITLLILFVAISYYVLLVPINLRSAQFYSYILFILCLLTVIFFIDSLFNKKSVVIYKTSIKLIAVIIVALVLSNLYSSPILQAKKYAMLIKKQKGVFETDVKSADFNKLPVVDRDMAIKLGARKMGEMGTLVSQYDIDETYSQICVKGKPLRVTPLIYADTIKWFLNKSNGIPYYINIDMVTQNSTLVKLSSPIKYSLSDKFSRNLYRHIRFGYPTAIISQINFEIDEDGKPYFIASVVEPTIGILGGEDVKAVIVINASTGEMKKYNTDEVPTWIDRGYPAELIIKQLTDNGQYERGFINSKVKQEGVTKPTEGYNYITMGEDIYLYTGITSVLSDESNIGFVFVNMRTKETKFYPVSSAEEFSVMESAAGAVQEKAYKATFPILINLYNRPTYFMALKDDAKLTKMYSLVDAQSYQKVAVGNTIQETVDNYRKITTDIAIESTDIISKEIVVEDVKSVVVDGNTVFYIKVEGENKIYTAPIDVDATLAFVKQGDILKVLGNDAESTFIVTELKK